MSGDVERFRAIGLSSVAAEEKARLLATASSALASRLGVTGATSTFWVPGRVEFLGKHTDYAGGRSLLCAVERGICIVASPRTDRQLRIVDASLGETVETRLERDLAPRPGHWSTYPLTVARRLLRDFGGSPDGINGADIAFASDLPQAAGMSSSSALVVATFLALANVNRLAERDDYRRVFPSLEQLAGYLGAVENGYAFGSFPGDTGVGTFGGSEDHTAILCARPAALVQYSFCPVRFERSMPLPPEHELVLASCGVVAEKIGAARDRYNALSLSTRALASRWRQVTGRSEETLGDAIASSEQASRELAALIRDPDIELRDRLEQFVIESTQLIPRAGDALEQGDLATLAEVVARSQNGAERLLKNQIPETTFLVREALAAGAVAASAFGAGFGGAVWALVRSNGAEEFRAAWGDRYRARFPIAGASASFFRTCAGPAASRVV